MSYRSLSTVGCHSSTRGVARRLSMLLLTTPLNLGATLANEISYVWTEPMPSSMII